MQELDLRNAQAITDQLDSWYVEMGLGQTTDFKVGKLQEEVIEVLEATDNYQQETSQENKEHLAGELADVLYCTLSLMGNMGIDANEAMNFVFTKNMARVNPTWAQMMREESGIENGPELYKVAKARADHSS